MTGSCINIFSFSPYDLHALDTSRLSLSSSHHVDCLKPAELIAEAAAFSSESLSADVSWLLKVPRFGRSAATVTRRYVERPLSSSVCHPSGYRR